MLRHRKIARQRLKDCTRKKYENCTYNAKLTPTQKQIIDMYIVDKLPVCEIAFQLSFCESLVRRRLSEVYDKVAKL